MEIKEFRKYAHDMADWIADYFENIESYPVKSTVKPGMIYNQIPNSPPLTGESMDVILNDVDRIILPGITHWQSPNFFAYFPANSSYPSVLAEMITASIGVQGMVWETSPAATELEEKVMNWLREMTGIPSSFQGVIQDTASTSTLVAILTAREKKSSFRINETGFIQNNMRIYSSSEAHSSVEKALKIAGFGRKNLVKIEVDENLGIIPSKLKEAIEHDLEKGLIPTCVVTALGSTGTCAFDPLKKIAEICRHYSIWHHVDAAYAGTALILPEYRHLIDGIEDVDSITFNPHKWMFTNFDCSAYFIKDKEALIKTFEIMPEYLKTKTDHIVNNYRDWGIQLGRRFRALKLWFVIREMGLKEIQNRISDHIRWSRELASEIKITDGYYLHEPQNLALVCFCLAPQKDLSIEELNSLNQEFLQHLNSSGRLYLSHTKVNGKFLIRMSIGQTYVTKSHVDRAWNFIREESKKYLV
jgi:aromatic-L-amino-acid/L-tryptophan decarboxylase